MATDRISIRLYPNLRRQLGEQASRQGLSESEVVRNALKAYLLTRGNAESCYDLARKTGIIGMIKNAPSDLSTNRRHFKGFGRR